MDGQVCDRQLPGRPGSFCVATADPLGTGPAVATDNGLKKSALWPTDPIPFRINPVQVPERTNQPPAAIGRITDKF